MVLSNKHMVWAAALASLSAFAPNAHANEMDTVFTLGAQTASDFSDFGMEVAAPGVTFNAARQHTERFSGNVWVRGAPNKDWSGFDELATEIDATGTYMVLNEGNLRVALTAGGYFFPADSFDATTWTIQGSVTYQVTEHVSFTVEHGEYFAGFEEGRTKAYTNVNFPIGGNLFGDVEVGYAELRNADTNPVFAELGLSHGSWRIAAVGWINTKENAGGDRDSGAFLEFSTTLK